MTYPLAGFSIDPSGQTAVVTFTTGSSTGQTATCYLDPNGVTPLTLPATINTPYSFYVGPGDWYVSATVSGFEEIGAVFALEGAQVQGFAIPSGVGFKIAGQATVGDVLTATSSKAANWQAGGGGGSGITRSINSISVASAAGSTASTDYVYLVSGTTSLTLPTAVGNTNLYTVKNTGSATVTVATSASQTIDGSASASLPVANTSIDLISDNANWRIV